MSLYFQKKLILNGWEFHNFWEGQVEKCGQNLKNAQSSFVRENILSQYVTPNRKTSENRENCVHGQVSTVPSSLNLILCSRQDSGFLQQYIGIHKIRYCYLEPE